MPLVTVSYARAARGRIRLGFVRAFIVSLLLVPWPLGAAQRYAVIDLGTLPGAFDRSWALGINNSAQVVGYCQGTLNHAFLWQNGPMIDLGTLGGEPNTFAFGINNSRQVVGYSTLPSPGFPHRAFLWQNGAMINLGTLPCNNPPYCGDSEAYAINDSGQVVGRSDVSVGSDQNMHAFLWQNGSMTDLGTLGGRYSHAFGINNSGQVVGESFLADNETSHAFRWQSGSMTDLGTLGGRNSMAQAINASGQVVGRSETAAGAYRAFLWQNGTMTDLGTLPGVIYGYAYSINDSGQVVGDSTWGFIWQNGRMTKLNDLIPSDSGWVLGSAYGINNAGQIVGWGYHDGHTRAYLLTPLDLNVDTDRNGTVGNEDEEGKDTWTRDRGAIFNVNYDRDGTRTASDGTPLPDAIHFDDDGNPVAEDQTIKNAADEQDIAPLVVRKMKVWDGVRVFLKVDRVEDARAFHLYKRIAAGETAIWGGLTETREEIDITDHVSETEDRTFGLEGLFFKGMNIPGAASPFSGYIDLKLELRSDATVLGRDKVRLKVAPWIMLPHTQLSTEVWAIDAGPDNAQFRAGLAASGQLRTEPSGIDALNQWFQDHLEIGYTHRPGGPKTYSAFRLPYRYRTYQPLWPVKRLLQSKAGIFQLGLSLGAGAGDYGGNLEVMPPTATHKLGKIVQGDTSSSRLRDFLSEQEVQTPFTVPTRWLAVGHIDEVFLFTPVANEVALADPAEAYAQMEAIPTADRGRAVFFATGATPVSGAASADATANNRIETGVDHGEQTWQYIRIYSGTGAGQVARIAPGGLQNGYIEVDRVWNTMSQILDGGGNTDPCIARYMLDEEAPVSPEWHVNPAAGDGYVLVEGVQFWDTGTPALVTVEEVLADTALRTLNTDASYIAFQIAQIQTTLDNEAGGPGTLSFRRVPVLYIGKFSGFLSGSTFDDGRSAVALTPGLANLMPVGNRLYFPAQYGPRDALDRDLFEQATAALFSGATFIDDWNLYHRLEGEVHCATTTKREMFGLDWWRNQP